MRPADYSSREYAVPFGRYEGVRPNEYPANEVLVGRERQRARMMDWLLAMGSKGAYLVTGYRGVGKSSFVQFCIREYEDDVYGRYLNSRVGRRLLWDRLIAALAFPASFAIPLCAAHILAGFVRSWNRQSTPTWSPTSESPLLAVIMAVLAYAVAQPLVRAVVLMDRAGYQAMKPTKWMLAALFSTVALVALCVSAPTAASFGCALLAGGNLVSRAWSVLPQTGEKGEFGVDPSSAPLGDDEASKIVRRKTMLKLGVFCFLLTVLVIVQGARPDGPGSAGMATYVAPATTLVIALAGLGLSFAIHSGDAFRIARHFKAPRSRKAAQGTVSALRNAGTVCVVAALVIMSTIAIALIWYSDSLAYDSLKMVSVDMALAGMLGFAVLARRADGLGKPTIAWLHFQPYPRYILAVRAAYTLMVGIELIVLAVGLPLSWHPQWPVFTAVLHAPFESWLSECVWVTLTAIFGIILLYFEEDWIARRHERNRRDDAYDVVRYYDPEQPLPPARPSDGKGATVEPPPSKGGEGKTLQQAPSKDGEMSRMQQLHGAREFARSTLFWSLFRVWLPTITIRVNLGFDDLSHSQVVKAMLMGLRDQYHRTFIAFRSPLAIWRRASRVFVAMIIAVGLGNHTARLADEILPGPANRILSASIPLPIVAPGGQDMTLAITGCRVALFLALLLLFRAVRRRVGFSHHRSTYSRLNHLLDALTASIRVTRSSGGGSASIGSKGGTTSVNIPGDTFQTDAAPQDPRAIEQAFLELLHDVQDSLFGFPMAGQWLSLAAPQVTFIFDELDKIGVHSAARQSPVQAPPNYRLERERSRQMHRLFADMKNLLSTAPARFIFVGGRELHDEWLADRTSQQPLLSNVFDAEIYLPTLLVDSIVPPPQKKSYGNPVPPPEHDEPGSPDDAPYPKGAVYAYLNAQLAHANALSRLWLEKRRWTYGLFGGPRSESEHFFVQEPDTRGLIHGSKEDDHKPDLWLLYRTDRTKEEREAKAGENVDLDKPVGWAGNFFEQFALYLGFRSRGNPKRLNALIERFVRPTGRVVSDPRMRWSKFDCQHVLRFGHVQRSTIQLIANIQRRLDRIIGPRVEHQDDKIIRSALYLADYLLKFHRRAFSWANLERIDELLHVHRAPDLRRVLSEMLTEWSGCFLNPIFEGMYDFRFRSEVAAEVRYISRRSGSEMAAFNFTLDESQALKTEYQTRLHNAGDKGEPIAEIHAALGELHDFDEEYEDARRHYLAAIADLDAQTVRIASKTEDAGIALMFGEDAKAVRRHVDWGISRLRLMLQIGMTYERSRNYERAFVQYRDARTLSTVMLFSLLDNYARGAPVGLPEEIRGKNRLETLKHLPLLYEPLFAGAWAAEKAPTAIDSSLSMVEEAIWDLRCRIPFVRLPSRGRRDQLTEMQGEFLHANFAMVTTALHHNAGNLYFFKGCQAEQWLNRKVVDGNSERPGPNGKSGPKSSDAEESVDGYLLQAQYHYACALHDVRRFSRYRILGAKEKFVPPGAIVRDISPLPVDLWPEFVLRRTAATLFCLADVWLGRISLTRLLATTATPSPRHQAVDKQGFVRWLADQETGAGATSSACVSLFGKEEEIEFPRPRRQSETGLGPIKRLLKFEAEASESEWVKIDRYMWLSSWGIDLLVLGGHYEEAAREQLWAAANIETILWSARAQAVYAETPRQKVPLAALRRVVATLKCAKNALEDALELLRRARGTKAEPSVPTFAGRIACSLGLLATRVGCQGPARDFRQLAIKLLRRSAQVEEDWEKEEDKAVGFRDALQQILERNAYSMLNHLHALRILIVDSATQVLGGAEIQNGAVVDAHMDELNRLDGEYAAPMHFTPFHYGTAAVLWGESLLRKRKGARVVKGSRKTDECIYELLADGRRALARSQQMYSSRQAYYEAISELYYLDDDFNDRSIHVHHALQMMGADLARTLLGDPRDRQDREPPVVPRPTKPVEMGLPLHAAEPDAAAAMENEVAADT